MNRTDQLILEGKFMVDLTEAPNSDIYPRISEKLAKVNEKREREGLQRFQVNWDSLYVEEDTAFLDAYLVCKCGDKVDMGNEEAVESGHCDDCLMIDKMEAYQNAPLVTPGILARLSNGKYEEVVR